MVKRITLTENAFVDNYLKNILHHFELEKIKNLFSTNCTITLFWEDLSVPRLDASQQFQVPASTYDIVQE